MKRITASLIALIYAFSLFTPAQAEPSRAPAYAFNGDLLIHAQTVTSPLVAPADAVNTYEWTQEGANVHHVTLGLRLYCVGLQSVGCAKADVYYTYSISVTYNSHEYAGGPSSPYLSVEYYGNKPGGDKYDDVSGCDPPNTPQDDDYSCSIGGSGEIPSDQLTEYTSDGLRYSGVTTTFDLANDPGAERTGHKTYNFTIKFSLTPPEDPCADYEPGGPVSGGSINATSETGASTTLVVGERYILTTMGGPWNNGTMDRYDASYRQGGAGHTWRRLSDSGDSDPDNLCVSVDGHIHKKVFTATATQLNIRVNDWPGMFADNTGSLNYEISRAEYKGNHCTDGYLLGSQIGTVSIDSYQELGKLINMMEGWPFPGNWIGIKIESGTWSDGGTTGLTELALSVGGASYTSLENSGGQVPACYDETNKTYFIQVVDRNSYSLRVADQDTPPYFLDNSGVLSVGIYVANYTPPANSCENRFRISGTIETKTVNSTDAIGVVFGDGVGGGGSSGIGGELPVSPDSEGALEGELYLMMEISGMAFYNGTTYSRHSELSTGGSTYYDATMVPSVECVNYLDNLGAVKIYFQPDAHLFAGEWRFRAEDNDTNRANNFGHLTYTLYSVDDLQEPPVEDPFPPPSNCAAFSVVGDPLDTLTIDAQYSGGYILTEGGSELGAGLYALETSGGPWTNDGVNSYLLGLREDGDTEWSNMFLSEYALCSEATDDNHFRTYIQVLAGQKFKARVFDEEEIFSDNDGEMSLSIYEADTSINDWTPCSRNYLSHQISIPDEDRTFYANDAGGIQIPPEYLTPGAFYGLEISAESTWSEPAELVGSDNVYHDGLYSAEVRENGGDWGHMSAPADWITCAVQMNTEDYGRKRMKIYFTANGVYSIRVNSATLNWALNTGYLRYKLYEVDDSPPPEPPPPCTGEGCDPTPPPPWASTCQEACDRPASVITWLQIDLGEIPLLGVRVLFNIPVPAVADWLDYANCAIQQYLAWCPEHTAALLAIPDTLSAYEPYGTILEMQDTINIVNDKLNTLSSAGGEASGDFTPFDPIFGTSGMGGEGDAPVTSDTWEGLVHPLTNNSPWNGGSIQWSSSETLSAKLASSQAYFDYCEATYNAKLGPGITYGLCYIFRLSRLMGLIWILVQLAFSAISVLAVIKYIYAKWVDTGAAG